MEKYDVVVIGGGHNGLIATAYFVKAGLNVCLVEAQDKCGGGAFTEELTLPGFKHDPFSIEHTVLQSNPILSKDELGLKSKYKLKYINHDPGTAFIFPDDSALIIYQDINKTCECIGQFSKRDAEAYPRFLDACRELNIILADYLFTAPPAFGNMISFLEASEIGREYLRIILGSALEVAEDWFESDQMKAAFLASTCEAEISPQHKGTGNLIFRFANAAFGACIPEGGSGALAEALSAFIKDMGGIIKVSNTVKSINTEAGEAKGVVLETGEEIIATKAIISTVNVKQLFLQMLKQNDVPIDFQLKIKRIRQSTYVSMKQDIALNEALEYKAGSDANKALLVRIIPFVEDMLKMFQELEHGIPQTKDLGVSMPTLVDPTRAPNGKHILWLHQYEPYNLKQGSPSTWDKIKLEIADGGLKTLYDHTTNLRQENILGRFIRTPLDFERCNPAWIGGDSNHMILSLQQMFSNRPLPGWSCYRTPVKKLYMCGASTYPGPGVIGSSRAAIPVIMEDLGIDFKKVLSK